jgi:hypothetical protein
MWCCAGAIMANKGMGLSSINRFLAGLRPNIMYSERAAFTRRVSYGARETAIQSNNKC